MDHNIFACNLTYLQIKMVDSFFLWFWLSHVLLHYKYPPEALERHFQYKLQLFYILNIKFEANFLLSKTFFETKSAGKLTGSFTWAGLNDVTTPPLTIHPARFN